MTNLSNMSTKTKKHIYQKQVFFHVIGWFFYIVYSTGATMISEPNRVFYLWDTSWYIFNNIIVFYSFALIIYPLLEKRSYAISIFSLMLTYVVFHLSHYVRIILKYYSEPMPEYYQKISGILIIFFPVFIQFMAFATVYWFYVYTKKQNQTKLILEQRNHEIEVSFLKSQINQHFIYNMLNMFYVNAMQYSDKLAGGILSLSELMRFSVSHEQNSLIPIEEELKYVASYIELNQLRFNEKLLINFKTEGDLSIYRIPHLCILTLVENAFKHGNLKLAPLDILIKAENDTLYVSLKNMKHTAKISNSTGIGLENLKRRLSLLLENRFTLETSADETFFYTVLTVKKL